MALSDDLKFKIGLTVVGVAVVWLGVGFLKRKIAANIPQVVKDGAEAAGVLAGIGWEIATDPLDAFGIVPADRVNEQTGQVEKKWTPATEEDKNAGPLRNEGGMDFTLF